MDSGFYDQKLMNSIEALGVGYECAGRFFAEIKALIGAMPPENFSSTLAAQPRISGYSLCSAISGKPGTASDGRSSGDRSLKKTILFPRSRLGTLAYTNLGMGFAVDEQLEKAGLSGMVQAEGVFATYNSGHEIPNILLVAIGVLP